MNRILIAPLGTAMALLIAAHANAAIESPPAPTGGMDVTSWYDSPSFSVGPNGYTLDKGGYKIYSVGWPIAYQSTVTPWADYQVTTDYNSAGGGYFEQWSGQHNTLLNFDSTTHWEWYYTGEYHFQSWWAGTYTQMDCAGGMCTTTHTPPPGDAPPLFSTTTLATKQTTSAPLASTRTATLSGTSHSTSSATSTAPSVSTGLGASAAPSGATPTMAVSDAATPKTKEPTPSSATPGLTASIAANGKGRQVADAGTTSPGNPAPVLGAVQNITPPKAQPGLTNAATHTIAPSTAGNSSTAKADPPKASKPDSSSHQSSDPSKPAPRNTDKHAHS